MRKCFSSVSGKNRGRFALCIVTCVLLVAFFALATGCRDTDALKEIIIDQNADLIDYDNPLKYYINDSTAEEESDRVSALEVSDEDPESDIVQNLIVYSSDPNTEGYTAKHSLFSAFPDFTGIEASDTVFFYYSDAVDAFEHALTPTPDVEDEEEPDTEEEQQELTQSTTNTSTTGNTAIAGASGGTAGSSSTPDSNATGGTAGTSNTDDQQNSEGSPEGEGGGGTGGAGGEEGEPSPEPGDGDGGEEGGDPVESPEPSVDTDGMTSTDGIGEYKNPDLAYDINNPNQDPPKVDSIAAFGDYALIVQMIGGSGGLAATDAVTLSALQDNGVQTTALRGWSGNSGDPAELDNVYNIVDSGAKIILVEDANTYTAGMNWDRYNYLTDNGVQFANLRTMYTSTNIKANVNAVGQMLDGSSVAAYGSDAVGRASYYEEFHNRVVSVNNGLANDQGAGSNGASSSRAANKALQTPDGYNNDADGLGFSGNTATYTVLVNDWESDAQLNIPDLSFDPGLGFASVGYTYSPFSYYMQAGGTINLAAAGVSSRGVSGESPVFQFGGSEGWTLDYISNSGLQNIYLSNGKFFVFPLLDSRVEYQTLTNLGKGLGSDVYPKLLVTTSEIKNAIVENSKNETSAYHPYGYNGVSTVNGYIGRLYPNGSNVQSACIGSNALGGRSDWKDHPNDCYEGYIYEDSILVNPNGYFCNWTTGTVESFLESGWIAARINGVYDYGQWQTDVSDFYSWAWGIDVNLSSIDVN